MCVGYLQGKEIFPVAKRPNRLASHSTPHLTDSGRHANIVVHMPILASAADVSCQRKTSCAVETQ